MTMHLVTTLTGRQYEVDDAELDRLTEAGLLAGSLRVTPQALDQELADVVADPQSLTHAAVVDLSSSGGVPAASTTTAGVVELATTAETTTGTDTVRAVTPAGVKAADDAASTADRARANHTGTQSLDTTTDSATRLAMTAAERTKLTGVATGATANATDAQLRDRSTHTGTQVATTSLSATGTKDATTFLRGDNTWAAPPAGGTPADATTTSKGIVQLAGHLGGTAAAPTVTSGAGHTHTASQVSDSTATGRSVMTATDAAAARTAIGAGTSTLAIGTTSTTAKAGDYQPTAANISDSTATGRSVLTAATAAAARTAIGAGVVDSADASVLQVVKVTQAAYDALGTKVATTLYVIVG